jgi:hypothetical protein
MAMTTFSGPVRSVGGFIFGNGSRVTKVLTASATLDFPSIAAGGVQDLTISVPGVSVGGQVALGLPAAPAAGVVFMAFVSAANTVTVRARNVTAAPVDPASATYSVVVFNVVAA